ncbi:MAG: haloacid dehalogenase type II [Chloroflexota bacterium]|nr:haloacid dehalogenase type II [Chloroflexota bacterium]
MAVDGVRALVFDVFGTVVDWRSSVIRDGEELGRRRGLAVDWPRLAEQWRREGYHDTIRTIVRGEAPWENVDVIMRRHLESILPDYGVTGLSAEDLDWLTRSWHRLDPWPDSVPGLARLKRKYVIATLSNGHVVLLTNMAKYGGLPWDCILSAELVEKYKPDPATYQSTYRFLGLRPGEVMMTAAHSNDLRAAREQGLRTAFISRPSEWGPNGPREEPDPEFDVIAADMIDLADKLGA